MNPFNVNHVALTLIVALLCVAVRGSRARAALLTALALFGVVFAGYAHPVLRLAYVGISLAVLLIGWGFGKLIVKKPEDQTKGLLAVALVLLFAPLFLFKLALALIPAVAMASIQKHAPGFNLASFLPVGISYFSFRSAAYLIEVRRRTIEPVGILRFFHYAFFWPTLLAGPIERPGPFLEQSREIPRSARDDILLGLSRFIGGFVKKTVLGSAFFGIARPYMELGGNFDDGLAMFTTPHLWLCVTAYYLYLYFDFSGYSDLAIGASRMMGFRIMENFRWPILAQNVADFWRRWHISLTSWITDYVYITLGGNRRGLYKAGLFTLIAMVLVGAWHGLNMHFLYWGAYHAVFLILYRQWRKNLRPRLFKNGLPLPSWLGRVAAWFLTFQIINLGWVLFLYPVSRSWEIWLKLFWIG